MDNEGKKVTMVSDSGEPVDFYVLEETRIGGRDYLLVTDSDEEADGDCYILKDMSNQSDDQALYQMVEDDREIEYLLQIFSQLLGDDVEIEM